MLVYPGTNQQLTIINPARIVSGFWSYKTVYNNGIKTVFKIS